MAEENTPVEENTMAEENTPVEENTTTKELKLKNFSHAISESYYGSIVTFINSDRDTILKFQSLVAAGLSHPGGLFEKTFSSTGPRLSDPRLLIWIANFAIDFKEEHLDVKKLSERDDKSLYFDALEINILRLSYFPECCAAKWANQTLIYLQNFPLLLTCVLYKLSTIRVWQSCPDVFLGFMEKIINSKIYRSVYGSCLLMATAPNEKYMMAIFELTKHVMSIDFQFLHTFKEKMPDSPDANDIRNFMVCDRIVEFFMPIVDAKMYVAMRRLLETLAEGL